MSAWGVRRQLTVFFFSVIIMAALGVVAFLYLLPEPSCFDGRQNQNELGVDCGGLCEAVCLNEAREVKIIWARIVPRSNGAYDAVALVENPNPDLTLVDMPYSFSFLDDDNVFISQVKGSLSLAPLSRFAIFSDSLNVGQRVPERAILEFTGVPIWERSSDKPLIEIEPPRFVGTPSPLLLALVNNTSLSTTYRNLDVVAVLSDTDQNVVAVSSTFVEQLAPGESHEVSFSWPRPFAKTPVFTDLYYYAPLVDTLD